MRDFVLLLVCLSVALSGCDSKEGRAAKVVAAKVDQAKADVAATLLDPGSAQFRNITHELDGDVVCGEINGKNLLGAYTGFHPFLHGAPLADGRSTIQISTDQNTLSSGPLCMKDNPAERAGCVRPYDQAFWEMFDVVCLGRDEALMRRTDQLLGRTRPDARSGRP